MSLRYTVGLPVDKSCWLRPRWAEFFPEQKKRYGIFLYWYLYLVKKQKTIDQFFEFLKIAKPWPSLSHRPCKNTRFRICLRQLWTTYHVIAQVGLVNMCACVEPVGTAVGAVCVEYGRPKWPITMLNHTHIVQKNVLFFIFGTLCSYDPLWTSFFFLGKPRNTKLVTLARLMIKILLRSTLLAPRGVTDQYLSWWVNIELARTACDETCGIEYQ